MLFSLLLALSEEALWHEKEEQLFGHGVTSPEEEKGGEENETPSTLFQDLEKEEEDNNDDDPMLLRLPQIVAADFEISDNKLSHGW